MKKSNTAILTAACTAAMSAGLSVGGAYNNNPARSQGAREFKRNKQRRKIANKSKQANRRKRK